MYYKSQAKAYSVLAVEKSTHCVPDLAQAMICLYKHMQHEKQAQTFLLMYSR